MEDPACTIDAPTRRSLPDHSNRAVCHFEEIYYEESGRAGGIPAVYLHGGPGGTLGRGAYRMKFDPDRFRTIGLEQRAAAGRHHVPTRRTTT